MRRWVALWDGVEAPWRLGLVRLLLGLFLLVEYLRIAHLGLVVPLFATLDDGGLVEHAGSLVDQLGPWTTWATLVGASSALALGVMPRLAAVVLVLVGAAHGQAVPVAHRAADQLVRDVLCILVFAQTAGWGSLLAWWRTGTPLGDGARIPSWPRRLIVLQLVMAYTFAGLQKVDPSWWPWGGATALFVVLSDPAVARFDVGFLRDGGWRVTQVLTVATAGFQLSYPLILVLWRTRLHSLFVGVGLYFHLGLAATMELGLFPWAMLALYPALLREGRWSSPLRRPPAPEPTPLAREAAGQRGRFDGQYPKRGQLMANHPQENPLFTLFALVSTPSLAGFVDFDDVTYPCNFVDSSPLTTEYASENIVFSGTMEPLNECGLFSVSNYSSPNFLAYNQSNLGISDVQMDFPMPVDEFSMTVASPNTSSIAITSENSAGATLESFTVVPTST